MKQLLRKGLNQIVVDEVPDPVVTPHHVIVRPHVSLISSGTETASLHRGGALRAVAENPSYIGKILDVMKAREGQHYRVRWDDGHETVFYPGADARIDRSRPTGS